MFSRRSLLAAPAILLPRRSEAAFSIFQTSKPSGFPGQDGNPVGFAAAKGFPGSLTPATLGDGTGGTFQLVSGSSGSPNVISFMDFSPSSIGKCNNISGNGASSGPAVHDITFVGCRFTANTNNVFAPDCCVDMLTAGSFNITFSYCTMAPLTSVATHPIPATAWPSSSVGTGTKFVSTGPGGNTYQMPYGVTFRDAVALACPPGGFVTVDHCDLWGFGDNSVNGQAYTTLNTYPVNGQTNITDCWIHDPRTDNNNADHTNGILPPNAHAFSNLLLKHNTISGLGNTNAIGFQHLLTAPGNWRPATPYTTSSPAVGASDGFAYTAIAPSTGVNPTGNANTSFWTQSGVNHYRNIQIINNHISGFNSMIDCGVGTQGSTNFNFTDNVISNYVMWLSRICFTSKSFNGPNGADFSAMFNGTGNTWRRNTYQMWPGSGSSYDRANAGKDGFFVMPDGSLSSKDWTF
jgi:hypothetical protein